MSLRQLRRAIVGANNTIVSIDTGAAAALVPLGSALARLQPITDDDLAAACGRETADVKPAASEDDDGGASVGRRKLAEKLAKPAFIQGPRGRTAIVSFRGLVNYDIEFQPYAVSSKHFARVIRELAADETVKSIVLIVDSPGGIVTGVPEAADALFAARESKKVTAVVDTMSASAAYWITSQATEIVCLPSGDGVGSIGVYLLHIDCSENFKQVGIAPTFIYSGEFKVEGNMFEPLGDVARERFQMECDTIYADFLKAVSRGRGVSVADVKEKFGKGRLLMPAEAKKLGMLDRLELTDDSFRRLGLAAAPAEGQSRADEEAIPAPAADGAAATEAPPEAPVEVVTIDPSVSEVDLTKVHDATFPATAEPAANPAAGADVRAHGLQVLREEGLSFPR